MPIALLWNISKNHISVLSSDIEDKVQTIAISSNDIVTHPSDSPDCLRNQAQLQGWSFPYLYDESQVFAKELKAACTPDFYLFSNAGNRKFSLFYHGQLDSSRPSNDISITGEDLRAAVKDLNKNGDYPNPQQPSLGCNIKWTMGKEPDWFKWIKYNIYPREKPLKLIYLLCKYLHLH